MKKQWIKRLTALALCAAMLLAGSATTWAESAGDLPAAAEETEMFSVSAYGDGVRIDSFSSAYIQSLTAAERQHIAVVIPATYRGRPVRAIGRKAFSTFSSPFAFYEDVNFTSLDMSAATELRHIEDYAFYSSKGAAGFQGPLVLPAGLESTGSFCFAFCSGFTGDLLLPNSLTDMGGSTFYGCSGLNGALRLPQDPSFSTVADQLFDGCAFTGPLVIPSTVTSIKKHAFLGNHFSGALQLPAGLTEIGAAAFSGCSYLTGALVLPESLTAVGDQAFQDCSGLGGVLHLPDALVQIGSQAFYGTGVQTVYLPNSAATQLTNGGSAFNSCSALTAIVSPPDLYTAYREKITASAPGKLLSYPLQVQFDTGAAPVSCLFGRPLNYRLDPATGMWGPDSSYTLPSAGADPAPGYKMGWRFEQSSAPDRDAVTPNTLVTGATLYAQQLYSWPSITQQQADIDQVYDGQPVKMTMQASGSAPSPYRVLYCWYRLQSDYTLKNIKNSTATSYPLQEPGDSGTYVVYPRAYDTSTGKIGKVLGEFEFRVQIRKRPADLHPSCSARGQLEDGLPALSLAESDTAGTISWDPDQTPALGKNSYRWTFTPSDPQHDEGAAGQLEVELVQTRTITATAGDHGSISPAGPSEVDLGQSGSYTFWPDPGYRVDKLLVDGAAVPAADSYTFTDVQAHHTIAVFFAPLQKQEVQQMIEELPQLPPDATPQQQAQATKQVLEAKVAYEGISDGGGELSDEHAQKLCQALAALPQVEVVLEQSETVLSSPNAPLLLRAMTAQEARALQSGEITHYQVALVVGQPSVDSAQQQAITQALGSYREGSRYGVTVHKRMYKNDLLQTEQISSLPAPIQLVLAVPEQLQAPQQVGRQFAVLRVHQLPGGSYTAQLLPAHAVDGQQIAVYTDRFSTYSLVYRDDPQLCQVTFVTGGSHIPGQTVAYGANIPRPQSPVRSGWQFTGWYTDQAGTRRWDFDADTVSGDTVLYAGWTQQAAPAPDGPAPAEPGSRPAATGDRCAHPILPLLLAVLAAPLIAVCRRRSVR